MKCPFFFCIHLFFSWILFFIFTFNYNLFFLGRLFFVICNNILRASFAGRLFYPLFFSINYLIFSEHQVLDLLLLFLSFLQVFHFFVTLFLTLGIVFGCSLSINDYCISLFRDFFGSIIPINDLMLRPYVEIPIPVRSPKKSNLEPNPYLDG